MTERLVIARLGHRGDGVVDAPAGPIYVPYALPGETVEAEAIAGGARAKPDRRHLLHVDVPRPHRIAPICRHFAACGGCAVQHLNEAHYRAWKRDLVVGALAEVGIAAAVGDLVDAHGAGRRRAVFHARRGSHGVLEVGFAAPRAHQVVAIDHCPVLAPGLAHAIAAAWAIAETLEAQTKPLDIQVTESDAGLDVDLRGSGPLPPMLMARLAQVAQAQHLARLTRHGELVAQAAPPRLRIGRADVVLPPGAFLQATRAGEEFLAQFVCAHVGQARTVADLFAGVGPFALRLAERSNVTAVDSDAPALAALAQAAAGTRGLKPVVTQRRDLLRRPLVAAEIARFDAVVLDPPRQGALAQAQALAAAAVPVIVAISCNPATFARDAKILLEGGYRLVAVTPVDQFRYAAHVEIAARFER